MLPEAHERVADHQHAAKIFRGVGVADRVVLQFKEMPELLLVQFFNPLRIGLAEAVIRIALIEPNLASRRAFLKE